MVTCGGLLAIHHPREFVVLLDGYMWRFVSNSPSKGIRCAVDGTVNHTVLTVIEKTESKFRNITGFTIK
jgi:hypothetical protein